MALRRTTRVMAVLGAATMAAATGLAPAAQAQPPTAPTSESAPSQADIDNLVVPPPLDPNYPVPTDTGKPDVTYTKATDCVKSGTSTVELPQKPWGQNLLRFDELPKLGVDGSGQMVAVIDTGVHPHEYLGERLVGGGDYVTDQNGLEDCDGHGTEVAGIIAANPNNPDIGFRGIAPRARILSIRQSSANYEFQDPATNSKRNAGNLQTLAMAIRRAADTPGVTVINMSVDSCRPASVGPIAEPEKQVQAALRYAVEEKNIVPVASAGNLDETAVCKEQNSADPSKPTILVIPPWFSRYVLSVGAMTENGDPAEFSIQGPWVSVAAPGTEIISLDPASTMQLANQSVDEKGQASPIQGTSFAAPYVAGLAALVRQRFPDLSAYEVMHRIKSTSAHPAANGGHNSLVGYGMVNPVAALTAMIPAEEGIPPDQPVDVPFEMPPPYERDWTPMQVAMIGSGGGLGLLLLTLFVVHTVRRNRRDPEALTKPRHRA